METVTAENKKIHLNPLHTYFSTDDFISEELLKINQKEVQLVIDNYSIVDYKYSDRVLHCIIFRDVKIMQSGLLEYLPIKILPCLIDDKGIRKLKKHNGREPICITATVSLVYHYNAETKKKDILSVSFNNWDYIDDTIVFKSA